MSQSTQKATLYRMSTPDHQCPFGLKTRHLLKANGYDVDDNLLESREETDKFKK
ncbi:MAG: glutaredoxin, partial [Idiomarina sp.]|nr:glutaredoxin [Idiomarina sp.]